MRSITGTLRAMRRMFRRSQRSGSRNHRSLRAGDITRAPSVQIYEHEVRGRIQDPEILSGMDEDFLEDMMSVVSRHLSDPDFDTLTAAREMRLSRMHLNRKLRTITGYSTREFVLSVRFRKARQLLRLQYPEISEIARTVGFRSPSHFSRSFRRHFGQSPTEFLRNDQSKYPLPAGGSS